MAFALRGHDAWSCDLEPSEADDGHHIQCDVLGILDEGWDLMVAHPPCTYLTNAGVRHLGYGASRNGVRAEVYGLDRQRALVEGADFFNRLRNCDIPRVAIENPVPSRYASYLIGPYTQLIQPWMFGHGETKATCLWLRGLPPLRPTQLAQSRYPRHHRQPDVKDRWKNRSRTYEGIALAMADQWT